MRDRLPVSGQQAISSLRDWLCSPGLPTSGPFLIRQGHLAGMLLALLSHAAAEADYHALTRGHGVTSSGKNVTDLESDSPVPFGPQHVMRLLDSLRCLIRQWTSQKDAAIEIEVCLLSVLSRVWVPPILSPSLPALFLPYFIPPPLQLSVRTRILIS